MSKKATPSTPIVDDEARLLQLEAEHKATRKARHNAVEWEAVEKADRSLARLEWELQQVKARLAKKAEKELAEEDAAIRQTNRAAALKVLTAARIVEAGFKRAGDEATALLRALDEANRVVRNEQLKQRLSLAVRTFKFFLLSAVSRMPECQVPSISDSRSFSEHFPQPDELAEKEN